MKKALFLLIFICGVPLSLVAEQTQDLNFMRGHICSKLEDRFPNAQIEFDIRDQNITIYHWYGDTQYDEIQNYLERFYPDYSIEFASSYDPNPQIESEKNLCAVVPFEEGEFLPELNPFFPTMLARPHILGYSVGYRSYDRIFKSTIPISIGDQFSLYQFKIHSSARLYLGVEACVWAFFEAKTKSLSLINADYFIGIPLTYIHDRFSARLRVFHQSSHLGDEFLLDHPEEIVRLNPSMEGADLSLAYEPIDNLVFFGGYSRILRSDDSFKVKPNCVFYGFNYYLDFGKIQLFNVEASPYIATYFANHENTHWRFDSSVAVGYQWDKSYGHKLRIYLLGHEGYSAEGQFARKRSQYISAHLFYGY